MIKKIILATIILVSSITGFSQFSFIIHPSDDSGKPPVEGFTYDYPVTYQNLPANYNFTITVVNGSLQSSLQVPPYQYLRIKWDCVVPDGSITLTETISGVSYTFNTTILSFLSSTKYCSFVLPAKQNNTFGQWPGLLDVSYCSPYCQSSYKYQWQVGDVAIGIFPQEPLTWTDIPSAIGMQYQPPIYNNQCIKAYRRKTTFSDQLGLPVTVISSTGVISTFDNLLPGAISGGTTFNNGVPLITQTPATGGLCDGYNYVYTWETSTDLNSWTTLGSGASYPPVAIITSTCYIRRRVDCGGQTLYSNNLNVIVQPLIPGTISGGGTYAFNTIPPVSQIPANGSVCSNPDYVYTWERSVNNGPWVSFWTGADYPNTLPHGGVIATCRVRRKVHCVFEDAYSNIINFTMLPYTSPNTENLNYVRVNDIVIPGVQSWEQVDALTTGNKLQTTNYLDGFGRSIQTVIKQGSLKQSAGGNLDPNDINNYQDLVSYAQYDGLGRADKGFLPYVTTTNLGFYKTNAATEQQSFTNLKYGEPVGSIYTYSQTTYDGSPINRVVNQKLPGYYWNSNPNYKGISNDYSFNKFSENIRIWDIGFTPDATPTSSGAYANNLLTKNITKDETDKLIVTYTDLNGNTILKRVQEANTVSDNSYTGWLNTYYVYDDFGRLRYTITPKAVGAMALSNNWIITPEIKIGLCFYQEYDKRGRVIIKHSPDGGEVWLIYDKRDRLVLSQDENQRSRITGSPSKPNQWSFSLYDENDRPLATGLIDDSRNRTDMQAFVDLLPLQNEQVSIYAGTWETITAYNPVAGKKVSGGYFCQTCTESYANSLNYYDDYTTSSKPYITLSANDFAPTTNPYVQQPIKSLRTKGMITTSKIRVLDDKFDNGVLTDEKFLISTSYIDERGRIIQSHAENILGGTDVASIQYDFAGKVLCTKGKHNAPGNEFDNLLVVTKNDYDLLGRSKTLLKLYTKNSSDITTGTYKKLSSLALDEFGRAKTKQIGEDPANPSSPLEIQDFTFNIQGNLIGINKDYALSTVNSTQWDRHFGMYFGYENGDGKFVAPQWNGNITGAIWRSQGDNTPRKYNYEYDNINRFKAANFSQRNKITNTVWETNLVDLSSFITYNDANGNISTMKQNGIIPGTNGGVLIDDLAYQYYDNSNRLKAVNDLAFGGGVSVQNGKQGDFKKINPLANIEYEYDKNGNLRIDRNKNIKDGTADGILSNFLDLPQQIVIENKSKTEYIYDAEGNKLAKKVTQLTTGAPPPVTTWYVGGFVYESSPTVGQPDALQYILNEEGKLRIMVPVAGWVGPPNGSGQVNYLETRGNVEFTNTGSPNKWGVWDYFIKDNLTNTRMVLTEEYHQQLMYCSMEDANANVKSEEEATFSNTPTNNELFNTRLGKPPAWSSNLSLKVSKLLNIGNTSIGPNAILKVMAGDRLNGQVKYFYQAGGTSNSNSIINNVVNSLLLALGGSPNTTSTIKDNVSQTYLSSLDGPVNSFLNNRPPPANGNTPKAYLNYIFFDEQFRYVGDGASGAVPVEAITSGTYKDGTLVIPLNTTATKNGYVYIYLSSESQNIPVYFDDMHIVHDRGVIVEDNAYYPFGLKIQGISAKAALKPKAKQGYQGDYSAQDDETGYNEFALRSYDPQIGRWIQVDPNDVEPGMYNGMDNNGINMVDPDGGDADNWGRRKTNGGKTWDYKWFDAAVDAGWEDLGLEVPSFKTVDGRYAALHDKGQITWSEFPTYNFDLPPIHHEEIRPYVDHSNFAGKWDNFNNSELGKIADPTGLSKAIYGLFDGVWTFSSMIKNGADGSRNMRGDNLLGMYGAKGALNYRFGATVSVLTIPLGEIGSFESGVAPNGKFYSTAFETKIPNKLYNKGPYSHLKAANTALSDAIASDAGFANSMAELGIRVPRTDAGTIAGKKIQNWVWHHNPEPGVMQLVPQVQHTKGSIFWSTLHPDGRGGMSIWGGGY